MIITITALLATTFTASAYRNGDTKVFTSITTLAMNGVVTYEKLCINGNNIETINPRKVCVAYKSDRKDGGLVCTKTEMQIVSKPLDYVKTVCLKTRNKDGKCLKSKKVASTLATSYTVTKTLKKWSGSRNNGNWGFGGKVLSKNTYEVPACN